MLNEPFDPNNLMLLTSVSTRHTGCSTPAFQEELKKTPLPDHLKRRCFSYIGALAVDGRPAFTLDLELLPESGTVVEWVSLLDWLIEFHAGQVSHLPIECLNLLPSQRALSPLAQLAFFPLPGEHLTKRERKLLQTFNNEAGGEGEGGLWPLVQSGMVKEGPMAAANFFRYFLFRGLSRSQLTDFLSLPENAQICWQYMSGLHFGLYEYDIVGALQHLFAGLVLSLPSPVTTASPVSGNAMDRLIWTFAQIFVLQQPPLPDNENHNENNNNNNAFSRDPVSVFTLCIAILNHNYALTKNNKAPIDPLLHQSAGILSATAVQEIHASLLTHPIVFAPNMADRQVVSKQFAGWLSLAVLGKPDAKGKKRATMVRFWSVLCRSSCSLLLFSDEVRATTDKPVLAVLLYGTAAAYACGSLQDEEDEAGLGGRGQKKKNGGLFASLFGGLCSGSTSGGKKRGGDTVPNGINDGGGYSLLKKSVAVDRCIELYSINPTLYSPPVQGGNTTLPPLHGVVSLSMDKLQLASVDSTVVGLSLPQLFSFVFVFQKFGALVVFFFFLILFSSNSHCL